jgi:hypothetical protein
MDHPPCKPLVLASLVLLTGAIGGVSGAAAQEATPPDAYEQPETPSQMALEPPQQVYTLDTNEAPQDPATQRPVGPPQRVVVPYEEGMTIPPTGYLRSTSRLSLWIPGLVLFAGSYFATGGCGARVMGMRVKPAEGRAWIPVFGGYVVANTSTGRRVASVSILAQLTGLAMFVAGLSLRGQELVYYTSGGRGLVFGAVPLRGGAMLSLNVF